MVTTVTRSIFEAINRSKAKYKLKTKSIEISHSVQQNAVTELCSLIYLLGKL